MRNRILLFVGCLAIASFIHAGLAAQSAPAAARPDLQGVYDVATMTPLERLPGIESLVLTKEQAAAMEQYEAQRQVKNDAPLAGDRGAPPVGGENTTPKS